MVKASPLKKLSKFINKKERITAVFMIIILISSLFAVSKMLPTYRETTAKDYLYYQSSYGFLGIGMGTDYEIGSINNKLKQQNKFSNVVKFAEYNNFDDSIYLGTLGECTIKIISRKGQKSDLNFCVLKDRALTYEANAIAFDKKNYKYVTLDGGSYKKPVNAIVIFNDKQEAIKDIRSKYRIDSTVILNHEVVFIQIDERKDDLSINYLNVYDLNTDKMTRIDLAKKYSNLESVTDLLQLDNDYLIAYQGKDGYNYVINSKGQFLSKRNKEINIIRPSYEINGKWYADSVMFNYEDSSILEYNNKSIRWIKYGDICSHYSDVKFNNKGAYCISKKDNKKLISILEKNNNIYTLDKKYDYQAYHNLVLFGFN